MDIPEQQALAFHDALRARLGLTPRDAPDGFEVLVTGGSDDAEVRWSGSSAVDLDWVNRARERRFRGGGRLDLILCEDLGLNPSQIRNVVVESQEGRPLVARWEGFARLPATEVLDMFNAAGSQKVVQP